MPDEISVPFLSYEDIRRHAETFLTTYHPSRTLSIPVEEIIDLRLKINIVPLPGLQQAFELDAFTSSDCTEITVDEFIYNRRLGRYRFSLAHELGHIVLHQGIFRRARFRTVREWIEFVATCLADKHTWIEWQAYTFAGLLLVPRQALAIEVEEALRRAARYGVTVDPPDATAWDYIAEYLAGRFVVSKDVIVRRLRKDGRQDIN